MIRIVLQQYLDKSIDTDFNVRLVALKRLRIGVHIQIIKANSKVDIFFKIDNASCLFLFSVNHHLK